MSIRLKILSPLLAFVLIELTMAFLSGVMSRRDQAEVTDITGKAIGAWDLSHKAHEDFARLSELVSEVTAMTHFVDAAAVQKRFGDAAASMDANLAGLAAQSQSTEMTELGRHVKQRFAIWRGEVEGVLGLKRASEIATIDLLKRDGAAVESSLNEALELAGHDARARIEEVGANARAGTNAAFALSILLSVTGAAGAFWLARNLALPLKALVAGAERLAGGDVGVTFDSLGRTDEVGEIARAVAAFRDNVITAHAAEASAAEERQASEKARRQSEELRAATGEEQARVVGALSEGLERLASRDLTYRVHGQFSPAYQRLKVDFNKSLDVLLHALLERAAFDITHTLNC